MKSIGNTVCVLPTKANNPRNGEGSFVRLADSRILYVYTKYLGEDWHDHAIAALYAIYSSDEGETWSAPMPNLHFSSPDAPMSVKHVGKYAIAVFNPVPLSCVRELRERWESGKRTPLIWAVSPEDAVDFKNTNVTLAYRNMDAYFSHCFALETDPKNSFCYPTIFETKDGFLVAYYNSDNKVVPLNVVRSGKYFTVKLRMKSLR